MYLHFLSFLNEMAQSLVDSPCIGPVMQSFDVFMLLDWRICWTNSQIAGDLGSHVMSPWCENYVKSL